MNFILLSEVVEETTQATKTIFGYPVETVAKFGILILIVVAISVWFIMRPTDEKKKIAQDYLTKMATQVMNIAFSNMSIDLAKQNMKEALGFDFENFKIQILKAIKDDSWDFVKSALKYGVEHNEIDPLATRLITEESVNALVDLVMGRSDMQEALKNAYNYMVEQHIKEAEEEEKKAKQLADWAESQPAEPSDPVEEKTVEALVPGELPPGVEYDPSATEEIIPGTEETVEIPVDPTVDPDVIDDHNNTTYG